MIYNNFKDIKLSALGMGTMRLPVIDGNGAKIDEQKTAEMFDYAIKKGVNYFDTAWGYHDGMSEPVVGKMLTRYPRESFYLATKFPGYDLANIDKVEEIFEKQLERLQVDYFDFYLIHNVCEMNIDAYLDKSHGIYDYLIKQKNNGRIKHLGFSAHGNMDVMTKFLDAYGKGMEFCQLQINYLDWDFQSAKQKVELVTSRGIPVWVMEPLRGGKLSNLPEFLNKKVCGITGEDATKTAFRFIQSLPEVKVTLSGMSNFEQLKQNIETFEEHKPLNTDQFDNLLGVGNSMLNGSTVPCTACRYCTAHCPKELDIPMLLNLYNEHSFTGGGFMAPMVLQSVEESKHPSACIGCKSCEAVCPQQIQIAETMAKFNGMLKADES